MDKNLINGSGFNGMVQGRHGYTVYNKNDMAVGKSVRLYGEFSEGEAVFFSTICNPGDCVMDIGANIGTHTLVFSKAVGKEGFVYAFEPQRLAFQNLCANMSLNSVVNVECFPYAVSNLPGSLLVPTINPEKKINIGGVQIEGYTEGLRVHQITIDTYFASLTRLDVMKIDTEGMEGKVLRGAKSTINKFRPILYVENDKLDRSKALIESIWDLGYRQYWHLPPLFNPDNHAGYQEDVFPEMLSMNMYCIPSETKARTFGFPEIRDSKQNPLTGLPEDDLHAAQTMSQEA